MREAVTDSVPTVASTASHHAAAWAATHHQSACTSEPDHPTQPPPAPLAGDRRARHPAHGLGEARRLGLLLRRQLLLVLGQAPPMLGEAPLGAGVKAHALPPSGVRPSTRRGRTVR